MKIDYTRYYLKWHDESDTHRAKMISYYRNLLESLLPGDKSNHVMDVGCGMGFALLALREMGYTNLSGVESDAGQAASCQAKKLNVTLADDTIEFLKQQSGKFDLIICLDVIEHIPLTIQLGFVQALAGALRSGGKLICTVPNANSALASRWRYNDWTHAVSFTEHSLDFLLYNGGFTDIRVTGQEFIRRPKNVYLPLGGVRHWWAFRFFRFFRRLEMMAELGPAQGRIVPLSLNLIATAIKSNDLG